MALDPNLPGAVLVGLSIAAEQAVARWRGVRVQELASSLSAVGTTLGQLVVQAAMGFGVVSAFGWLGDHLAVVAWPTGAVGWILGFAAGELVFYWRHRLGHSVHLFWCVHAVHHQSTDFNLVTAQRVGWLQWAQTLACAWPLAVLGMPAPMFGAVLGLVHLYNFFTHTTLVGRLGPLERVLVTPSHHRVHHGRNPRYLDKNYGFSLIVFDRLFGTFQEEDEPVRYGTLDGLDTWNPLANNLRPWATMVDKVRAAPTLARALQVPLRHPAWDPVSGEVHLPKASDPVAPVTTPSTEGPPALRALLLVETVAAVVLALALVQGTSTWPTGLRVVCAAIVLAVSAGAGMLDGAPAER